MRRPPLAIVIPTYGIEDFKRKGKTSFLYRQLDGSYIGIAPCTYSSRSQKPDVVTGTIDANVRNHPDDSDQ